MINSCKEANFQEVQCKIVHFKLSIKGVLILAELIFENVQLLQYTSYYRYNTIGACI